MMDNQETLATLGTQVTGQRKPKTNKNTQHRKLKKMSNTEPTKHTLGKPRYSSMVSRTHQTHLG